LRWIIAITILLVALGAEACRVDVPSPGPDPAEQWVRTADGWQKPATWRSPAPVYYPSLHPLVVALGETFLSIGALLVRGKPARGPFRPPD
jgi:hypothetical protein